MSGPPASDADVFAEAVRLPPAERAAYLTRVCGGDAAFRGRLDELLETQERLGEFLEETDASPGRDWLNATAPLADAGRVGRYRLLETLGEGGCGVVYLAEQHEPVKRQVALKIIKPGMDTQEVIARFGAERQALAMMDHPGIAKVFDAGETKSGRLYFVMELIRGTRITDYCDQHRLSIEERLQLFVRVCHAIQHAHQKGVIHRDIKPSNILVTTVADGGLQPVVIDFGIAKATANVRLTDKTLFTAVDMLIGTPTYMSPEQTAAASGDIDTRTDIYSLGVLLYELLVGKTPFDSGELLQLGMQELRRAICEREPLRPSARLGKMSADDLISLAKRRAAEPAALVREVRGDLDWIAMKALEKDRARRYATANDLASDVARFLADQAILARPVSALYRLRKSVVRNKLLFGGLTVLVVFLAGAWVAILLALGRERHARAEADAARRHAEAAQQDAESGRGLAQTEATRSKHVTQFLQNVLLGVGPDVAQGRDTTVLRGILERAAANLSSELADQPQVQAELRLRIGEVYADIQLLPEAEEQYRRGIAVSREAPQESRELTVRLLRELGWVLIARARLEEAKQIFTDALALSRAVSGPEHSNVPDMLGQLANIASRQGRTSDSEKLFGEALAIQRRILPADSPDLARTLFDFSLVLDNSDFRLIEAEKIQREALQIWLKIGGPLGRNVDVAHYALARTLGRQNKDIQALEFARQAADAVRTLHGADNPILSQRLSYYGFSLTRNFQLDAADAALREALGSRSKLQATVYHSTVIGLLSGVGAVAELRGQLAEAEAAFREAWTLSRALRNDTNFDTVFQLHRLAGVLLTAERGAEADRLFADYPSPGFFETKDSAGFLTQRAHHFARQARWTEAASDARTAAKLFPKSFEYRRLHATLLVATGAIDDYRAERAALIADYTGFQTGTHCARLAMVCLLIPADTAALDALARYCEKAVTDGLEGKWAAYAQCAQALCDYRRSRYTEATTWAEKSMQSLRPDVRVMSRAILAMATHQLGDGVAAQALLEQASHAAETQLPARDSRDLGPNWIDWINADLGPEWMGTVAARTVLAEANALIRPPQESVLLGGRSL